MVTSGDLIKHVSKGTNINESASIRILQTINTNRFGIAHSYLGCFGSGKSASSSTSSFAPPTLLLVRSK